MLKDMQPTSSFVLRIHLQERLQSFSNKLWMVRERLPCSQPRKETKYTYNQQLSYNKKWSRSHTKREYKLELLFAENNCRMGKKPFSHHNLTKPKWLACLCIAWAMSSKPLGLMNKASMKPNDCSKTELKSGDLQTSGTHGSILADKVLGWPRETVKDVYMAKKSRCKHIFIIGNLHHCIPSKNMCDKIGCGKIS